MTSIVELAKRLEREAGEAPLALSAADGGSSEPADVRYLRLLVEFVQADDSIVGRLAGIGEPLLDRLVATRLIRDGRSSSMAFPPVEFEMDLLTAAEGLGKSLEDVKADWRRLHVRRAAMHLDVPGSDEEDAATERRIRRDIVLGDATESDLMRHVAAVRARLKARHRLKSQAGLLLLGTADPELTGERCASELSSAREELRKFDGRTRELHQAEQRARFFEYSPDGREWINRSLTLDEMRDWLLRLEASEGVKAEVGWTRVKRKPEATYVRAMTSMGLRHRISEVSSLESSLERLLGSRKVLLDRVRFLEDTRTFWNKILV